MSATYLSAAKSKVVMNIGEATEATIGGLNALTLPRGFSRDSITLEAFGRDINTKIATGATYKDLSFKGNLLTGDTNGQDLLLSYAKANTEIKNIRFYLNDNDFCALNLAADPTGYYQIVDYDTPEAPKSGIYTLAVSMIVGGDSAMFTRHNATPITAITATTIVSATAADWATRFNIGDVVVIDGNVNNKGRYGIVTGVAATTLTFAAATWVIDAAPSATLCKVHGGI